MDASLNLINEIKNSDIICVENKYVFEKLINSLSLSTKAKIIDLNIESLSNLNFNQKKDLIKKETDPLLLEYKNGKKILCLSDEGSSVLVDPFSGFRSKCINNKIPHSIMAGPSAAINSILNSPFFDGSKFVFLGMIQNIEDDEDSINLMKTSKYPCVIFLPPYKIDNFLQKLCDILGVNREATICISLTTDKEIVFSERLSRIQKFLNKFSDEEKQSNQFALVIQGKMD